MAMFVNSNTTANTRAKIIEASKPKTLTLPLLTLGLLINQPLKIPLDSFSGILVVAKLGVN